MERTAEEPGRPGGERSEIRRKGINNQAAGPVRESDRLIVARKRVMIVERRGLTRSKQK